MAVLAVCWLCKCGALCQEINRAKKKKKRKKGSKVTNMTLAILTRRLQALFQKKMTHEEEEVQEKGNKTKKKIQEGFQMSDFE